MLRDINEVANIKRLNSESLARISCNDCKGCSECCHVVEDTIILDPFDVSELTRATGKSFQELMGTHIELRVVDAIIAPHILVKDVKSGCSFLNSDGRCTIHDFRPGFCRLFPLGRIYHEDNEGFDYFVQEGECPQPNKSKVKISKWLGYNDIKSYEAYVIKWHSFIKSMQGFMQSASDEQNKQLNMILLNTFFITPYNLNENVFSQVYARIEKIMSAFM